MGSGFLYHWITLLNASHKKSDHILFYFSTSIGAAVCANLDTVQLDYYTRTVLVDTVASQWSSDGEVIPVSEVHELLITIHGILDNTVSK